MNGMENVFVNGVIKGMEWADANPAWRMCEDELPEIGKKVLCATSKGAVFIYTYEESTNYRGVPLGSCRWNCSNYTAASIIAWLPLPKFNPKQETK